MLALLIHIQAARSLAGALARRGTGFVRPASEPREAPPKKRGRPRAKACQTLEPAAFIPFVPQPEPLWDTKARPGPISTAGYPPLWFLAPARLVMACAVGLARGLAWAHLGFVLVTSTLVACYAFVDPSVTVLSIQRRYADGYAPVSRPMPVTLEQVPKTARRMLVSVEDSGFWTHPGFSLEAFVRAAEVNKRLGRPLYGGSTISMQVARTLFLLPVKSYLRKYLELVVTVELELILSKERILELYLSWAEWGKGVYGIDMAARHYYRASASKLTTDRSARLLAILSSPLKYGPGTLGKSDLLRSRYDFLVKAYQIGSAK
ncbi:MAG: transglycosylase domain-containing protein [Spirochaetales bacterium]|nr:transglycosylase domain-containing protein [Spirochaetales bacterium]